MRLFAIAALALGLGMFGRAGAAEAAECSALANLKLDAVNLLSAAEVPAAGDLPAYCRVLGYVRPAINFEVRLPLANWNGKFYEAGCGGFCGAVDTERPGVFNAVLYAQRRNYAVAAMDSGHWGSSSVDGRWAFANPVAKADWAWRAATETARVGKALVGAYYGQAQKHAYFNGCSTGGRMAGVEATRFPGDFDGIIMGAPALDELGLGATLFAWLAQADAGPDGKPLFSPAKLPLLQRAVAAACGDKDGLVADPRRCAFAPETLQCKAGEAADCLSAAEVGVLQKWYGGAHDARGAELYPGGIPPGSEANWGLWLTGIGARPPAMPLFAREILRYLAFEPDAGPTYKVADFDFDRDPPRMAPMAALYNVLTWVPGTPGHIEGGDLSAFAQRGGKMVIWHGWGDPLVTPYLTVDWFEAWARRAGGMDQARAAARLFMVPGMDHCGINAANPGITDTGLDPLTALEQWVEQGKAPDSLLATKRTKEGQTVWQRPICAYPAEARLTGGDPAEAANWTCAAP
jgi:feruloyl esterase